MVNRIIGITGFFLGVATIVIATVYPARTAEITILAIAASGLLIWFFISHFDVLRNFSSRRTAYLRLNTVLMIVFFIFIVTLLNLIANQYYFRYDYSTAKKYSLAPQSRVVAKNIDSEIKVMFFGIERSKEFKTMYNLLESYRYLNRNIVYEMYDLDRVPLIAKKYSVKDYNTIVVTRGDRVTADIGADEQTITNILIRATRERVLNIGYLTGHNEHPLREDSRSGYSRIAGMMEDLGYNVHPVNLLSEGGVPWKTDVLIIASPEEALTDRENEMLLEYRKRGGKFLILINSPRQLRPFLGSLGLGVSKYPIYDAQNVAGTDPSAPVVTKYYNSPVTRNFGG